MGLSPALLERLRGVPRGERAVWALALFCLLATPFVEPLVRALDPALAVSAAYRQGYVFFSRFEEGQSVAPGARDPWGNAWCWRKASPGERGGWTVGTQEAYAFYSAGPNGVDERGAGDDIAHRFTPAALPVAWATELLTLLALMLIWFVRGPWASAPRAPGWRIELGRALLLASLPAVLSVIGVHQVRNHPWAVSLKEAQPLLIPAEVAWYGSAVLLWLLVGLAVRFGRGEPGPPPDPQVAE